MSPIHPTTMTDPPGASLLGPSIEKYLGWLRERRSADSVLERRGLLLHQFGEFGRARAVTHLEQLPGLVEAFVDDRIGRRHRPCASPERLAAYRHEIRQPIEQLLDVVLPDRHVVHRPSEPTFFGQATGFFVALRAERGLRDATIQLYRHHLARFEQFVTADGVRDVGELVPDHLDRFVIAARARLCPASLPALCSALRLLLRWLYREQRTTHDLSACVGAPHVYRLSGIPRSIAWVDVERTLSGVDRGTAVGRRDYAMLLLMVLYGLRSREVAALTLDDLDWRGERLHVGGRKAGHSTTYPLSSSGGEALIAYLRDGRPVTTERRIFLHAVAPRRPVSHHLVSDRARRHLLKAGIAVRRPGSHTLRHSCAQRLVDADFSLKVIGDYLGHGAAASTEIYTKVAVETLRQVALGNGEVVL